MSSMDQDFHKSPTYTPDSYDTSHKVCFEDIFYYFHIYVYVFQLVFFRQVFQLVLSMQIPSVQCVRVHLQLVYVITESIDEAMQFLQK
jgi:hypothetical protein